MLLDTIGWFDERPFATGIVTGLVFCYSSVLLRAAI